MQTLRSLWTDEYYDSILFAGRYDFPSTYPTEEVYAYSKMLEALYRKGTIDRRRFTAFALALKRLYGLDFAFMSKRHAIVLPNSTRTVKDLFFTYPHMLLVEGARNAGKTITLWDFALSFLKRFDDGVVYVYNDVDGLGDMIIGNVKKRYADRISIEDDGNPPPVNTTPKLALINEVSEKESSRRTLSGDHLDLAIRTFRLRHSKTWYISANIMHTFFGLDLRNSSDYKIFKWTTIDLAENIVKNSPKVYAPLVWKSLRLKAEEAYVVLPERGKGTYFGKMVTRPPDFLLELQNKANKNIEMMNGNRKEKKEKEWLELIIKARDAGYTYVEIARALKGEIPDPDGNIKDHGFRHSYKKVERMYKDYLKWHGVEK